MQATKLLPWNFLTRMGLVFILVLVASPAQGNEFYYLIVFGAQKTPTRPRFTHSWATFVKATGEGSCPDQYQLEYQTISWMPSSLDVRLFRLCPESGTNLDLSTTLNWALSENMRISMWGPFQIKKELFDRAGCQIAHLQCGIVRYKAVDTGYRTDRTSNCIHAVGDLIERNLRLRVGTPGWGEVASYLITLGLRTWMEDPGKVHPWVSDRLGLENFPIIHRDLHRGLLFCRWQFRNAPTGSH